MKPVCILFLMGLLVTNAYSQEPFFSKKVLVADVNYLEQQIRDVHADPSRELDAKKWEELFGGMRNQLKDSMTKAAFFSLIKPAVAFLSDEHADIGAPSYFNENPVFLPFGLTKAGERFMIDTVLGDGQLQKGMQVVAVNKVAVAVLARELTRFTTGFADERNQKVGEQFGYLYGLAHPYEKEWTITFSDLKEVKVRPASLAQWTGRLNKLYGVGTGTMDMSYMTYGKTGYLTIPAFAVRSDADERAYSRAIDSIFGIAAHDKVARFVIDVSRNSGGNSVVGTMLIDHFYSKPYLSYQMNWRRSDEYLGLMKKWGSVNGEYEALAPGQILHNDASPETLDSNAKKFKGKVYIVIGNGSFSSAIMFATIVKDNRLATLIGQAPRLGHPTHFGEQYGGKLPNTQLSFRFGVKEWIRPLGSKVKNVLTPDILLPEVSVEAVLKKIE